MFEIYFNHSHIEHVDYSLELHRATAYHVYQPNNAGQQMV